MVDGDAALSHLAVDETLEPGDCLVSANGKYVAYLQDNGRLGLCYTVEDSSTPDWSINDTFKGQLDLERHGGHTPAGVMVRVLQRILALTAAIWHNDHTAAAPSNAHSSRMTTEPFA